jgi:hypothetical protein
MLQMMVEKWGFPNLGSGRIMVFVFARCNGIQ